METAQYATVELPNGNVWTPRFVESIDRDKCIGCGRCFRVCGRDVLSLAGVTDEGELIEFEEDFDDDDDEEYEKKVMTVKNRDNCIGCEACSRICPKNCYTHAAALAG